MELQTKFIEGTNEQYSIREDGAVFSNYAKRIIRNKEYILYKTIQLKPTKSNCIKIDNYKVGNSISNLIFKHFGYCICKQCNKKLEYNSVQHMCKECAKNNIILSRKKFYNNNKEKYKNYNIQYKKANPEKHKEIRLEATRKVARIITKSYVSKLLPLSIKDITDEIYHLHRNTLLFKRQIAKEHNINIKKLN
jgi:hypothetical protein